MSRNTAIGLCISLGAALFAGSALLQPGYYDSHDGLLNVHRLFELEKCLEDGQLPCRWVPDMGAGYGYPLFNFYPPLATFVAEGFRLFGASILDAVKASFLVALALGSISMFSLAHRFFGSSGGVLAAILYTLAPYLALDIFVRGALAEVWGLALLPLVFLLGFDTVAGTSKRWSALGCAVAWAALLLAHGLTALMAAAPYALWLGVWITKRLRENPEARTKVLVAVTSTHVLALALAAWFVLPSLVELRHVHADTLTSLYEWARWENNFVTASELLLASRPWGYGPLRSANAMSLFVGPLQLVVGGGSLLWLGAVCQRERRLTTGAIAALLLGLSAVAALLMCLSVSKPIWQLVPGLGILQFPWRFLTIATFGLSFAAGWLALSLHERPMFARAFAPAVVGAACAITVVAGAGWFRPSAMQIVADSLVANERAIARARHGLFDFLPAKVDLARFIASPPNTQPPPVHALSPEVAVDHVSRTSNRVSFEAQNGGDEPAVVRINSYDFPGWRLEVDDQPAAFVEVADPLGRLHVRLPPGAHRVRVSFGNTPIRSFANIVSVAALIVLLLFAVRPGGRPETESWDTGRRRKRI
jgi:hypothetical protein